MEHTIGDHQMLHRQNRLLWRIGLLIQHSPNLEKPMIPFMRDIMNICLTKRLSGEIIAAAEPHKMDGWASSVREELDDPDEPWFAIEDDREQIIHRTG